MKKCKEWKHRVVAGGLKKIAKRREMDRYIEAREKGRLRGRDRKEKRSGADSQGGG
jgi:hypothetical protein